MNDTSDRLAGRVAIVTGGGRGIGKRVALAYAREGADVAVVARSTEEITQAAGEIKALGRKGLAIQADVCRPDDAKRLVESPLEPFGKVDVLCNAAGTRAGAPS